MQITHEMMKLSPPFGYSNQCVGTADDVLRTCEVGSILGITSGRCENRHDGATPNQTPWESTWRPSRSR
jgi:hypothetical protein